MDIKIEEASISDLAKFYEIEQECFEQEAFTKQQLAYLLTDYSTIGLAARVNGEIAGFAMAQVDIRRSAQVGHIVTVDVTPAYRRKGVAQKLLREIEAVLREGGFAECLLEVRENNVARALTVFQHQAYVSGNNV